MPRSKWSRRDMLRACLASGVLVASPPWTEEDVLAAWFDLQAGRAPTPHVEMGPFYKKKAPSSPMLRRTGDAGMPLSVSGRVLSAATGNAVPEAKVEIWQADHGGLYDLDGYRFRATLSPGKSGDYGFESVMPGHYPARVARHVHYLVTAPGYAPLSTQLYFATDEVFEGDPDKNFKKDPLITSREIVRPVTLTGAPGSASAKVSFELVLEKAR